MSDQLLPYYNRELAFIRRMGAEFAEAHPKIAGRLQLGADTVEDPHVERMIEAFALLNARTRHKLDDDYPELTDALLGVLYPHYQAPVPSMSILQFELDRGQAEMIGGYTVQAQSPVEAESADGEPCRFRTCYAATLWPIEVASADLVGRPFSAPQTRFTPKSQAVLRLTLKTFSEKVKFADLKMESLRFFLKGQAQHVFPLYELLLNNTLAVALASSADDSNPVVLPADCLCPVGFERDQGMFPYSSRSFLGYRLLTEYFTFPEKFLFLDLKHLDAKARGNLGRTMEIYFYLDQTTADLEQNVTGDVFQLGCSPMVNLHQHRAEPIPLRHTQSEYRVVPDARRPLTQEVYSIDRVTATAPNGDETDFSPFYSTKHASAAAGPRTFWHGTRRIAPAGPKGAAGHGTDIYLSLVDLDFSPSVPADATLHVETTCLDRNRPRRLSFGEGQPRLRLTGAAPLSRVACLVRPTPVFRPALRRGALWRVVSHLSLNHLSLADTEQGAEALREILNIYDFADSAETRGMIEGVLSVQCRRVVGRVAGGQRSGFCRGLETTVHFDEQRFTGAGVYLFASVLERFLGLYCSINSFSKLVATTNKREGELRRWPPRAGQSVLL